MSRVNSALTKISEQKTSSSVIEKAHVPEVKKSISPLIWIGVGVSVSLAIGGYTMSVNNVEDVVTTVEPNRQVAVAERLPAKSQPTVNVQAATPTVVRASDTASVTVYPMQETTSIETKPSAPATQAVQVPSVDAKITAPATSVEHTAPALVKKEQAVAKREPKPATKPKAQPKPVAKPQPKPVLIAKATPVMQPESMTIEQVEITPRELSEKAVARANKAIEANDAATAIREFTKALRLVPSDEITRQKLAALYYGKRDSRRAIDLLQQGIKMNEEGERLRIALSKLLMKDQQTEAALAPLFYVPTDVSSEYMALRAGIAQQVKNVDIALESYASLTEREPDNGRWWLGLAIQQERALEFDEALESYQHALGKIGLSNSSQAFIRQRLELLHNMQGADDGN